MTAENKTWKAGNDGGNITEGTAMQQEPRKLKVPTIYVWPIFQGYINFREYPQKSYGQTYGTNVPPF